MPRQNVSFGKRGPCRRAATQGGRTPSYIFSERRRAGRRKPMSRLQQRRLTGSCDSKSTPLPLCRPAQRMHVSVQIYFSDGTRLTNSQHQLFAVIIAGRRGAGSSRKTGAQTRANIRALGSHLAGWRHPKTGQNSDESSELDRDGEDGGGRQITLYLSRRRAMASAGWTSRSFSRPPRHPIVRCVRACDTCFRS